MDSLIVFLVALLAFVFLVCAVAWWFGVGGSEDPEPLFLVPVSLDDEGEPTPPAPQKVDSTASSSRTIIKTGRTEFFLGGSRDESDYTRMI